MWEAENRSLHPGMSCFRGLPIHLLPLKYANCSWSYKRSGSIFICTVDCSGDTCRVRLPARVSWGPRGHASGYSFSVLAAKNSAFPKMTFTLFLVQLISFPVSSIQYDSSPALKENCFSFLFFLTFQSLKCSSCLKEYLMDSWFISTALSAYYCLNEIYLLLQLISLNHLDLCPKIAFWLSLTSHSCNHKYLFNVHCTQSFVRSQGYNCGQSWPPKAQCQNLKSRKRHGPKKSKITFLYVNPGLSR